MLNRKKMNYQNAIRAFCSCAFFLAGMVAVLEKSTAAGAGEVMAGTLTVTDMAGRRVTVPDSFWRVVTIGKAPIINTFIFSLGKGETIVNGLPLTAKMHQKDCCRFQSLFARQLASEPSLEGGGEIGNLESLLLLRPNLVITGMKKYIDFMDRMGIPVIYVEINENAELYKEIMALLGKVYHLESKAEEYVQYFNSVMQRVRTSISDIAEDRKARVLYCNAKSLSQSSPTAAWWIEAAGGINLGRNSSYNAGTIFLSPEQVLLWDPDFWIVSTPEEIDRVYEDPRFRNIKAIKNKKVVSVPTGALRWSHPTSEQPLGVLWAASLFYPYRFYSTSMEKETQWFYRHFFEYQLTDEQIEDLLGP